MSGQQVTLVAVGDLIFEEGVSENIEKEGPDFPFSNVVSELRNADVVFGNLEGPLTTRREKAIWSFSKYGLSGRAESIFLKGSPAAAIGLKNAGFNVVSIANNHILDYGIEAANETIVVLRENSILPVGFGVNLHEALAPKFLEVKGVRFAFLACSFAYEATFFSPGAAPIALRTLKKQMTRASRVSDIVVVSLHVGIEFEESPSLITIRLARSLIETGAHLVLCHHPHTLQKIETYRNGLIAYSLGHFIFDYQASLKRPLRRRCKEGTIEKCRQSVILKCTLSKVGLVSYSVVPVRLNNALQPTPVSRNSKVGQTINDKLKTPLSFYDYRHDKQIQKGATDALIGFAVILRRRDLKGLCILLTRILHRLLFHT